MKVLLGLGMFYMLLIGATAVQKEAQMTDPNLPPTVRPIEEMNTTPNPVPSQNESEHFEGSTIEAQEYDEELFDEEMMEQEAYDENIPIDELEEEPTY